MLNVDAFNLVRGAVVSIFGGALVVIEIISLDADTETVIARTQSYGANGVVERPVISTWDYCHPLPIIGLVSQPDDDDTTQGYIENYLGFAQAR